MGNLRSAPLPSVAAGAGPFLVSSQSVAAGGFCQFPARGEAGLYGASMRNDSAVAIGIRQHEYGHLGLLRKHLAPSARAVVRIRKAGIHEAWLQGALDVQVNAYMLARDNLEIAALRPWGLLLDRSLPRWVAAILYLRCEALPKAPAFRMSLVLRTDFNATDLRLLNHVASVLRTSGESASPIAATRLLLHLDLLQNLFGPDRPQACHPLVGAASLSDQLLGVSLDHRRSQSSGNLWGEMEVVALPLTNRSLALRGRRSAVAGFAGPFRYPSRAWIPVTDGRAFAVPRDLAGTVLVDCSGSMAIGSEDLSAILAHARGITVASYGSLPVDLNSGRLVVLARGDRFADTRHVLNLLGKGNVVDGPALKWLNRQPAPRVWISDGGVTGIGDRGAPYIHLEIDALVRAGRIRRFGSVKEYLEKEVRR